jgi:hypothetical protein
MLIMAPSEARQKEIPEAVAHLRHVSARRPSIQLIHVRDPHCERWSSAARLLVRGDLKDARRPLFALTRKCPMLNLFNSKAQLDLAVIDPAEVAKLDDNQQTILASLINAAKARETALERLRAAQP